MHNPWKQITREDVIKAIENLDKTTDEYPEPRNTFLKYHERFYPAKHIRGLAYYNHYQQEISNEKYNGGTETVDFFINLGFTVKYKGELIVPPNSPLQEKESSKPSNKSLNPKTQKEALKRLLHRFGAIKAEQHFPWPVTPDPNQPPIEYQNIIKALINFRGYTDFLKKHRPQCDIVLEDRLIIIEYDEKQHFTEARWIALENYPPGIKLGFDKTYWQECCRMINAKDNDPFYRDEQRAFYDSVRDIEAARNDYILIRLKHGDYNWEDFNAKDKLEWIFQKSIPR